MIGCRGLAVIPGVALAFLLLCKPATAALIHLRIDPAATQIVASVKEPLARFRGAASGTFTVISGTIDGDWENPAKGGHVEITIDAASYNSGSDYRDKNVTHDALEVARFPVITFVSTRIENFRWVTKGVEATAMVVGNLTLHGVTREIQVPIDANLSPDRHQLNTDADVTFVLSDFAIKQPSTLFGALKTGRKVSLNFHVVAMPAGEIIPTPAPQ